MPQLGTQVNPDILREQFEATGHVYAPAVYDEALAAGLDVELARLTQNARRSATDALGEEKKGLENPTLHPDLHPNTLEVLGAIGMFTSNVLGRDLWSVNSVGALLLETIDMKPFTAAGLTRVEGNWHTDRTDIAGIVAVSTYQGISSLEFRDGNEHELKPGGIAVFDHSRLLMHRGIAYARRKGFVVARAKARTRG